MDAIRLDQRSGSVRHRDAENFGRIFGRIIFDPRCKTSPGIDRRIESASRNRSRMFETRQQKLRKAFNYEADSEILILSEKTEDLWA